MNIFIYRETLLEERLRIYLSNRTEQRWRKRYAQHVAFAVCRARISCDLAKHTFCFDPGCESEQEECGWLRFAAVPVGMEGSTCSVLCVFGKCLAPGITARNMPIVFNWLGSGALRAGFEAKHDLFCVYLVNQCWITRRKKGGGRGVKLSWYLWLSMCRQIIWLKWFSRLSI